MTRQELDCSNCGRYVQFDLDFDRDGNHEVECPHCHHIHYRVIQDGKVTGERYASSMGVVTYTAMNITSSTTSISAFGTGMTFSGSYTTSASGSGW